MEVRRATSLLLFVICIIQFQHLTIAVKVPPFEDGKSYIYQVQGRISTGVQDQPFSQYSGMEVISNIVVQNYKGKIQMRISNAKIKKFNQKFKNYYEEINLPFEDPDAKKYQLLTYPFEVHFEDGLIKSIDYYSSVETEFDQNLQRSMATAFQLNLKPQGSLSDNFYSVMEKGIGGECSTIYQVSPIEDSSEPRLFVSKIPLYNKCAHTAHLFFSSVDGQPCSNCHEQKKIIKRVARTDYVLRGSREKYVIEKIDVQGGFVFNPYGPEGKTIVVLANQTFTLIRTEKAKPLNVPQKKFVEKSPVYEFNMDKRNLNEINLKEAHYFNRFYDHEYNLYLKNIVNMLPKNASVVKDQSKLMIELIKQFSRFKYDQFVEFFDYSIRNYFDTLEDEETVVGWLLEVISMTGTNPAIKFILDSILKVEISSDLLPALRNIPFYVKEPTETLIKEFWNLILNSRHLNEEVHLESVLSFGTLLYKGCVASPFNPHPQTATTYMDEKQCLYFLNELIKLADNKLVPPDVTAVYLSAVANTRMDFTFPFFGKILTTKNDSFTFINARRIAINSMLTFIPQNKIQVASLVGPIFYNYKEDISLRTVAFDVLLMSLPTSETVASIIDAFRKEPYMKMRSYIYNTMSAFANLKYPCYSQITKLAKDFLKFVAAPRDDILRHGSKYFLDFMYLDDVSYGDMVSFSLLPSSHSFFPSNVQLQLSKYIMGYNFNYLKSSKSDTGETEQSHFRHSEDDILEDFRMSSLRASSGPHRIPFSHTEEQFFDQYITPMHIRLKHDVRDYYTRNSIYSNIEYTIPTEVGWPATFSMKFACLLQNKFSKNLAENETMFLNNFIKIDSTLQIMVEINKYGFYSHGLKATHTTRLNLPFQGAITPLEFFTALMINYTVPPSGVELYHRDTNLVTIGIGGKELAVKYRDEPFQDIKKFGHKYLGVGLTSNYTYDNIKPRQSFDFLSLQTLTDGNPMKILKNLLYLMNDPKQECKLFYTSYSLRLDPSQEYPTSKLNIIIKKNEKTPSATDDGVFSMKNFEIEIGSEGKVKRHWSLSLIQKTSWPVGRTSEMKFHFKRSPIPQFDKNPFEVCFTSNATKSDYNKIYEDMFGSHQPTVQFESSFLYGSDCKTDPKEIAIKGLGERSDEQNSLDRKNLPIYHICKKQIEKQFPYHYSCWEVIKDQTRLDNFTFDIQMKNIPTSHVLQLKASLFALLKPHVILYQGASELTNYQVRLSGNISYNSRFLDIHLDTLEARVVKKGIYLPSYFQPYSLVENFRERTLAKIFNYHKPMCIMSGNYIKTTDDLTYEMAPIDNCFYILYADCLTDATYILMKNTRQGKVVLVIIKTYLIFLDYSNGSMMKVTVNGQEILKDPKVVFEDFRLFTLAKYGKGILLKTDISLPNAYFDGKNIKLQIPDIIRGRQCGLCGDFNGEKVNDFVTANGTVTQNVDIFTNSYKFCHLCEGSDLYIGVCREFNKIKYPIPI